MKSSPKIIDTLNNLLSNELTAVNQYMVHAEMCGNWGYEKLEKQIEKRAITEMRHAETLISRILFLEGIPVVSNYKEINIGKDVPAMFAHDHDSEIGAIGDYNAAIVVCAEARDYATREILEKILQDEDGHVDEIENVQDEIGQMGIQMFLSTQLS